MTKKYWIRIVQDDGSFSVLSHRDKTEFCKRTAMKYADEFFNRFGKVCYIVEA